MPYSRDSRHLQNWVGRARCAPADRRITGGWLAERTSPNQALVSTSVSSAPASAPGKRGTVLRRWVIGISALLLTLLLFIVIRTQGHVTGQEFSPTHFQQRDFSFYEIPLIHVQITPINRSGSTPTSAMYLRQNSLVRPFTGPPQVWHLVSISRGLTGRTPADPQLLLDQLNLEHSGDSYWRKWSIDHANRAKVLWPVVQKLAQRELYILLPELFELAQLDLKPQQLRSKIDQILRNKYHGLIVDMQAADRDELAQQLLLEAISDYPDDSRLIELQSRLASAAPSDPIGRPDSAAGSGIEP
jgi:hypothetical protein